MAVQPLDPRTAGAAAPQAASAPAPAPREAANVARNVAHAPVEQSYSALHPFEAGLPVEMGDKGRIVRIMV